MGIVIGIDLGTTNSAVSILKNGKPVIIENEEGDRLTPSVVSILESGEILVGNQAKKIASRDLKRSINEVKRKMGTKEKIRVGDLEFLPEEISAYILKYLKECVESRLGEKVTEAVITVPAAFNDLQRKATKDAGEIAGLKVERIINEPTAAALAYGVDNFEKEETILVYDLGGGTFDVTVLELFDGIFDIKSSEGDTQLGGRDFDKLLMEYVYKDFLNKGNLDVKDDTHLEYMIKNEAEIVKKELSFKEYSNLIIQFIQGVTDKNSNPLGIDMNIRRAELESLIYDLVYKTNAIIDLAIKNAPNTDIEDIDTVLAIGGSTRTPLVRKLLEDKFGDKVRYDINPDEAVALGAAVQGGIKSGAYENDEDFIVTDVSPYTLGVEIRTEVGDVMVNGVFDPLILKNMVIPATKKKIYSTSYDYQDKVIVNVFQGDEVLAERNDLVGSFQVDDIPKRPATVEKIEIEFNYDINGMLEVNALVVSTGTKETALFGGVGISDEEKRKLRDSVNSDWKKSKLYSKVNTIIESAERSLDEFDKEDRLTVEGIIIKIKEAVLEDDEKKVDEMEDKLTDLLFSLMDK